MAYHNPFLVVVFDNFNVKSENWYKNDKTSCEGAKIDALTTQFGLQESLIQKFITRHLTNVK